MVISKAKGTVTYSKVSGNKKITINSETGKIKIAKGLKKGLYSVTVKVSAKGNTCYKAGSRTVDIDIQVK